MQRGLLYMQAYCFNICIILISFHFQKWVSINNDVCLLFSQNFTTKVPEWVDTGDNYINNKMWLLPAKKILLLTISINR